MRSWSGLALPAILLCALCAPTTVGAQPAGGQPKQAEKTREQLDAEQRASVVQKLARASKELTDATLCNDKERMEAARRELIIAEFNVDHFARTSLEYENDPDVKQANDLHEAANAAWRATLGTPAEKSAVGRSLLHTSTITFNRAQEARKRARERIKQKIKEEAQDLLDKSSFCPPRGNIGTGPPPDLIAAPTGGYAGIEFVAVGGLQTIEEFVAATGVRSTRLDDERAGAGGGIVAGYNFALGNGYFAGPFASFDAFAHRIDHSFGLASIGTDNNWVANVGAKLGKALSPTVAVYGLAGLSVLNYDFRIDFGGPVTSDNRTVLGGTVGAGLQVQPAEARVLGQPLALFVQYQYSFYDRARIDRPIASPFFNYEVDRSDHTFKAGLIARFRPAR